MRVAVLGAGFMGATHARAYHALDGVEIAGIYAPSPTRAEALAAEVGTRWTDSWAELVADPGVDAVDICLPTPQHRETTEAALAAGTHVLLEKPLALTEADAEAIVDVAEASDRIVMIAHVLRFWPEYVELKRRVAAGAIGAPLSAVAQRRQAFPAWSTLFTRADLTGGAVVDMLVHDYDVLNWLFGAPQSLSVRGRRNPRSGGWDQAQVLIDYGAASALVDGGAMMPDSFPFSSSLEVVGEDGAIAYHFRAGGRSVETGAGVNELVLYPERGEPQKLAVPGGDPYLAEVRYFVECVRGGMNAERATPREALVATRMALRAKGALEAGERGVVRL